MTTLQRTIGPAARRPHLGRWASLCLALFCLGFTFRIPSSTSAAAPHQEATPVPSPTPTCEQRCNARAHEVYEACIAMGRGPDAFTMPPMRPLFALRLRGSRLTAR